ncbi:phosphate-selective porin O and P [Formosa agariphila KMM 3901]|uniref:Phosphate-selective porin O and P n=1 Tax=Formosa agariphila (strain DSM 15362 / KCTC 12365 / LMG 23005 / KMM 3901 / M-2Alg 35-1) TaxID=1347342 RepID=T2KJZ4_FORAG|nr:porin [Formosa agariphila]CDF78763.1 phosphate-selective porin O and P [Formosa agariphila KMM 3901]
MSKKPTIRIAIIVILFSICNVAFSQHTDLVDKSQTQILADTTRTYFIPDATHRGMRWTRSHNKWFTTKLGFSPILDYNLNIQDQDSKDQVGSQESRFDIRSARVMLRGDINFKTPWHYLISVEYKGFDRGDDDPNFGITDFKIVAPLSENSDITFGKIKETFVYEMVGDAANLPHFERLLSPFFNSRNIGVIYHHFFLNNRLTASAGFYKDWFASDKSFSKSNNTFTARVTGLPKWENDGKQFMHMGIGVRYVDAVDDIIQLKGKNESNITSNYVDTGAMDASNQLNVNIEQLWSLDNFSVLMEYVHNWTDTKDFGTEQFNGYYVTGSYVLSGEQRPYDQRAAYARRIKPTGKYGAWEIFTRVGRTDLETKQIHGGINNRYDLGLNWWATQYWKAGVVYGISNLERDGLTGITNNVQFRIQWIY